MHGWLPVALVTIMAGGIGCAGYWPVPLPEAPAAAETRPIDLPRLRVTAGELRPDAAAPAPIDLADGLDPDEGAVLAVMTNPDLVAARDAHGEGEAQLVLAGILPNPTLAAGLDHPYGSGSAGTANAINLSLGADLKPLVARAARRRAAKAGLEEIDLGIAWQEWQVAQQARLLVVRLGWLRKRVGLAREEVDFAEQVASSTGAAQRAGDVTLEQMGIQRAALESVRRVTYQLQQAEAEAENALRTLLGNPRWERLEVTPPSPPPEQAPPTVNADACFAARLDLTALRRGYQAEEERVREAVLEQFPAVTVGVAYRRDELALHFFGGFLDFALPVFDRNQAPIRLGLATRRRLEHEYEARVARARGDLDGLLRFSSLLARQLPEVRRSIPPLEEIELKEREAVARGDLGRLSYQTVRSALFDQRLQEAAVSQALAETRVAIETTCGVDLRRTGSP